jgi:hypothetical protein
MFSSNMPSKSTMARNQTPWKAVMVGSDYHRCHSLGRLTSFVEVSIIEAFDIYS